MGFPDKIKRIKQRCFLTQQDFSKEIKVAFSTVNRLEGGKAKSILNTMKNIKEFYFNNNIEYTNIEEVWLNYDLEDLKNE